MQRAGWEVARCWMAVLRRALVNGVGLPKLKQTHLGLESRSILSAHLVSSTHGAKRRGEWTAGRVLERLSRPECGLLPDDARTVHLFRLSRGVEDQPVAIEQFDALFGFVGDGDRVEKEPLTLLR